MKRALIAAVITGIGGITIIAVCAILMGHNTAVITGTTSAIVAVITALITHYRTKAKERCNEKEGKE